MRLHRVPYADRSAEQKLGKRGEVFTFTIDYLAPVAEHSLPTVVSTWTAVDGCTSRSRPV